MRLGSSLPPPEQPYSKELNIKYPKAIDGDAIVLRGPNYEALTWVKYGGQWDITSGDDRFPVKRILEDSIGVSKSPIDLDPITGLPVVDFPTGGISAGNLALIGLLGFLLLRGAIK